MRIGFDAKRIYHNFTGLGNYSRDLVSLLSKFQSKNVYLLYNPKKKKIDRLKESGNLIERLPKSKFWIFFSSLWRQGPVVKQLCKDNVQIFHGLSGEIPRGIEFTNIKSVVTIHDLIFMRYPDMYHILDRKIHLKKFLYASNQADIVIAISEQTKRDIIQFLDVDPNKIRVVYQGCHNYFKTELSEEFKNGVLNEFSLPENFILNVGTIEERKNLLSLVKAVKDLDVNLVVVGGKTPYYKVITNYIKKNNLGHKVTFLENVGIKQLVALYQLANLFVYPSIFEGFGIPIIEALFSKTPVITSKGGCFSESGGPSTVYIDALDVEALKENIEMILSDKVLVNKMTEKGFEFVQKFNDHLISENIIKIYREIL
ncbi:glycosyltransferase family 1 protein [Flavicella sp.]|uniref:glycosyltransferase family 4 protein n=1 Tax=Flavicella sp. TaxID=2957742 RepID=UPI0030181C4C